MKNTGKITTRVSQSREIRRRLIEAMETEELLLDFCLECLDEIFDSDKNLHEFSLAKSFFYESYEHFKGYGCFCGLGELQDKVKEYLEKEKKEFEEIRQSLK